MAPKIYFIGTGKPELRGELNEGGFLIETEKTNILVDPGPGAAQGLGKNNVDAIIITSPERGYDAPLIKADVIENAEINGIKITKKQSGYKIKLPECTIAYITEKINLKEIKEYDCDALILYSHEQDEKLISKIKPKLAVLTGYDAKMHSKNPTYIAREIQQKTGIQTIAANDKLTVDLYSYSAIPEQKSLIKFTKDK